MNTSSEDETYDDVLVKRVRLMKHLRSKGVSGVVSVAITRQANRLALLVLTEANFSGVIPERFEGTPVVVSATGPASTQLSTLTTTL